jgi:hypothetical protein
MSSEKETKMIPISEDKDGFVLQRPDGSLMIPYLNKVVNAHIRDDIFSQANYDKITKNPLFTKIIFALDDSIQRFNETYDYLKEFSKPVKEILNSKSLLETAGFSKINKEFILKLYHYYLNKYKQG